MKTILLTLTLLLLGTSFIGIIDYVFFSQEYQDYSYMATFLLYMAIGGLASLYFLIRLNKKKPVPKEQTICQKALAILEAIPSNKIITSYFVDSLDSTRGCASGHILGVVSDEMYPLTPSSSSSEANSFDTELRRVTTGYLRLKNPNGWGSYVSINNHATKDYPQDNPKDRVIALLKDCVKAGL